MRQEIRKFEQYKKQFKLLHDENITTVSELEAFIGKLSKQIDDLDAERKALENKHRRAKIGEPYGESYKTVQCITTKIHARWGVDFCC